MDPSLHVSPDAQTCRRRRRKWIVTRWHNSWFNDNDSAGNYRCWRKKGTASDGIVRVATNEHSSPSSIVVWCVWIRMCGGWWTKSRGSLRLDSSEKKGILFPMFVGADSPGRKIREYTYVHSNGPYSLLVPVCNDTTVRGTGTGTEQLQPPSSVLLLSVRSGLPVVSYSSSTYTPQ